MNCVSLISTVHEEMALANVSELCAILERIQPEVIFLEVPPEAFDYYCYQNSSRLELKMVRHIGGPSSRNPEKCSYASG
jgi:hypothetical protein